MKNTAVLSRNLEQRCFAWGRTLKREHRQHSPSLTGKGDQLIFKLLLVDRVDYTFRFYK